MKMLPIYTRDDAGVMTYQGEQDWESEGLLLAFYDRSPSEAETVPLLGWPHAAVTWYGNIGIGHD